VLLLLIFRPKSFVDFSRDLAGVALPLPIGDRRLSVMLADPEFRVASKMVGLLSS
jgi:IclR family transcriptional regulator, acetate operon repressor